MEILALVFIVVLLYVGVSLLKDESGNPSGKSSRRNSRPNSSHRE